MKNLKTSRAVTYRRYGTPAVILEGKWLTDRYRWKIGDRIQIEYLQNEIRLRKSNRAAKQNKISPKGDYNQTHYTNQPSGMSIDYEQPSKNSDSNSYNVATKTGDEKNRNK